MPEVLLCFFHINSSMINTATQAARATTGSFAPLSERSAATARAARADYIDAVAERMAGKVITDRVT